MWDPQKRYLAFRFVRQAQTWPDLLLKDETTGNILMRAELKGWFALAKEGEPSFRYKVKPEVCMPEDLLVVFPWTLEQILSGKPILLEPFIEGAKYCAELRDYYWRVGRNTEENTGIMEAEASATNGARDRISNHAEDDKGGNYGRLARGKGAMVHFVSHTMAHYLCGIPVGAWQAFFKACSKSNVPVNLEKQMTKILNDYPVANRSNQSQFLKQELIKLLDEFFVSEPGSEQP